MASLSNTRHLQFRLFCFTRALILIHLLAKQLDCWIACNSIANTQMIAVTAKLIVVLEVNFISESISELNFIFLALISYLEVQ